MERKVNFDSIAELQETYPIGSSLISFKRKIEENRYFYDEKDLKILNQQYDIVTIVDKNVCHCQKMIEQLKIVEGYLYDGEYWRPAYNSWDGWLPYDEDDFQ